MQRFASYNLRFRENNFDLFLKGSKNTNRQRREPLQNRMKGKNTKKKNLVSSIISIFLDLINYTKSWPTRELEEMISRGFKYQKYL